LILAVYSVFSVISPQVFTGCIKDINCLLTLRRIWDSKNIFIEAFFYEWENSIDTKFVALRAGIVKRS